MSKALEFFRIISAIPRPSYHEEKIAAYLVSFATERGLAVVEDEMHNVVIRKPATPGYEHAPAIMLQSHTDMVAEKVPESDHDFLNDPLRLIEKEGMLYADGTTLGADDGVGVAYMLAILDDDTLVHPALTCVFTVQEETGLTGAVEMDLSDIDAKYIIGLDCSGENVTDVSCLGGVRGDIRLPIKKVTQHGLALRLIISGLLGGHSGGCIDFQRANSLKLLGTVLWRLRQSFAFGLADVSGGAKENAIPRDASVVLVIAPEDEAAIRQAVEGLEQAIRTQYQFSDPDIRIQLVSEENTEYVYDPTLTEQLVRLLKVLPYGTRFKNMVGEYLVTDSANLGVLSEEEGDIRIQISLRAALEHVLDNAMEEVAILCAGVAVSIYWYARYPGWAYNPVSPLRDLLKDVYQSMRHEPLSEHGTQGGVELGVFFGRMQDVDMVGIGPRMYDIHTPNEHLDLASFVRTYDVLTALLKETRRLTTR